MSISRRRGSAKFNPQEKGGAAHKRGPPNRTSRSAAFASARLALFLALALFQLRPEGVDVVLADDLGRDDHQAAGGNDRLVPVEILRHRRHALIAPLVGLLDDG